MGKPSLLVSRRCLAAITIIVAAAGQSEGARLLTGFEGCNIYRAQETSPNNFTCEMKPDDPSIYTYPDHHVYWFSLGIAGAKDQSVTVSVTNCDWMPANWSNYKPVLSYATDPNDRADHGWKAITNAFIAGTTFRFTQTYTADTAWVALRYPYMYTYLSRYVESVRDNEFVTVDTLARTAEGRSVFGLTITDRSKPGPKKGVLVFARDHASEQDPSWLCEGIIEFLLSESTVAAAVRRDMTFLVIPMVKPDASFSGRTVDAPNGLDFWPEFVPLHAQFGMYQKSPEARGVWQRITEWQAAGDTLVLCLNLHNPHGDEQNVWLYQGNSRKGRADALDFHQKVTGNLGNFTHRVSSDKITEAKSSFASNLDSVFYCYLGYEINMHASGRFLELADFDSLGVAIVNGIAEHYNLVIPTVSALRPTFGGSLRRDGGLTVAGPWANAGRRWPVLPGMPVHDALGRSVGAADGAWSVGCGTSARGAGRSDF